MKKLLLFIAMTIVSLSVMAQSGNYISYQSVVRDANNRLVTNEAITVTIQILDNSNAVQYTETDDVNSNANGLISLIIGDNNPTEFAAINWEGAKFKTTVHVNSTGYEVVSTSPVNSVPLALYSSDVNPSGSTVTAVYNKMQADSLALAQRITADSIALHKATKDSATTIRAALEDTASAIRNSIGDGTLTITYGTEVITFTANQKTPSSIAISAPTSANNGEITITRNTEPITNGKFTVNQSNDQTIDIEVPTKLSDLPNDGGHYAKRDSVNVFTTDNDFTGGSIKVPSKFDIHNPPTAATCTDDAVNVCDLVAVFDSLMKRVDSLADVMKATQQELDEIKTAVMPVLALSSNKPLDISAGDGETVEIKYSADITNSNKTFSYSWYVNGAVQGSDSSKLIFTANTAGAFKVLCVATSGAIVLKDSMTTTICIRPSMEYAFVGGNSTDFGKVNIISSTATAASWRDKNGVEIGAWNSGLTDILPVGEYTVVLASAGGCDSSLTIKVISSPLCAVSTVNATNETSVTVNGHNYVTAIQDHQGNQYNVVEIAGYCWTRENMRCTQYYDAGTTSYIDIPDGGSTGEPDVAYRYDPNPGIGGSVDADGYLYNWTAAIGNGVNSITAMDYYSYARGICPEGWHVPSYYDVFYMIHAQVTNAINNAGMLVGSVPRETWTSCCDGTSAPGNYNYADRNSTGFNALCSGYKDANGYYGNTGAYFWTSFNYGSTHWAARYLGLLNSSNSVLHDYAERERAFSVRCVRD